MRLITFLSCLLFSQFLLAFEVVEVEPAANSIVHAVDEPILIHFDDAVDINSVVAAGAVSVFGRWSGPADIDLTVGGFGNTLIINLFEDFFAGEYVMVQLSRDVSSIGGEGLDHGYSFGFWVRTAPGYMDLQDLGQLDVREPGEGLIQSYGAYAGDINDDGWSDLTVVNETSGDMRIFLSDNGSFSSFNTHELPLGNKPSANEGSDFNGDGIIDLTLGNTQGNMMSILMGTGGGNFEDEVIYTADQGVRGVTILDLEGDGDMDVVSANRQGSNLSVFVNDGEGNFATATTISTPLSAETAITAADMNEDGATDLIIGGFVSDDLAVLLNDGDGNFTLTTQVDTEDAPWMITMGDVNGDGHVDIAAANSGANRMSVHLGDGLGGLSEATVYPTGGFPLAIDLGDLDGDGDLDMISSNYSGGNFSLYENLGEGTFGNLRTLDANIAGSCAIFHDRDHDGVMDITGIDELADVLLFFGNTPNGVDEHPLAELLISPNPFNESFRIDLSGYEDVETLLLMDMDGRIVAQKKITTKGGDILWAPEIDSGSYLLVDGKNNRRLATLIKH